MEILDLAGEWEFRQLDKGPWQKASVPGGIYSDLLANDVIPDPLEYDNELDVQWVGKSDWEYRREFFVDESFATEQQIFLSCDGLDTIATLYLNDIEIGQSQNMHVGYDFPIDSALESGQNELRVVFESPVEYARTQEQSHPYEVPGIRYPVDHPGRPFIRKAQCHFGWDWGPCLPTVGIYRDISLVATSGPLIRDITVEQNHGDTGIRLDVVAHLRSPISTTTLVTVEIAGETISETCSIPDGDSTVTLTTDVTDVELWWPNGYGEQPLYELAVTVGDDETHTHSKQIGFRDLQIVTEPDDAGRSFYIEVNGEPIFAKGANTIPIAPLYRDVTEEKYDHLIESAAAANMNMLRVWGGGYYESDRFYELCDEHGLLVWQDFMFACALYPATESFLESVKDEVRYQVRRLQSHPCIALWCGNNENEEALTNWFGDHAAHEDHVADFERLYHDTIIPTCEAIDPTRLCWPGSPSSGKDTTDPYRESAGDIHFWDVWHAGKPFEAYLETAPRFVSEFGYQSFPSTASLLEVLDESDLNPTAPLMEHHQRNPGGNKRIVTRLCDNFRFPWSFDDFVFLTQLQQGMAMQTAIEHWRRRRPVTMGALYWQLNDLWPVASWSSIEYYGRWKVQQYWARRQFAPTLLSFAPLFEPDTSNETDEFGDIEALELWVTNDQRDTVELDLDIEVFAFDQTEPIQTECAEIVIEAGGSEPIYTLSRTDLPDNITADNVMIQARADKDSVFAATGFFEPFKRLSLRDPNITLSMEEDSLAVEAVYPALFVTLTADDPHVRFSDNAFHLAPGMSKTITYDVDETDSFDENSISLQHLFGTYRDSSLLSNDDDESPRD